MSLANVDGGFVTGRKGVAKGPVPVWVRVVREPLALSEAMVYEALPGGRVREPSAVEALLRSRASIEEVEVFWVVALTTQARVTGLVEVSRGLLNTTLVHPREVFRAAIVHGAAAIIIVHNHPSGEVSPSVEDRTITRQLVAAGKLLDVPVHDHVIVGAPGAYFSFATAGLM